MAKKKNDSLELKGFKKDSIDEVRIVDHVKFRPFMNRMEHNRKIKYSVEGYALSIQDYTINNQKSGWSVELRHGNGIDPKKFDYANLADLVKSEIRQATHYVQGEKDGRQILYYACGSPSRIDEYKSGKRHGLQIKFFPKNKINADEFSFDLSCKKIHKKIMNIELYKDGSKVTNPFLIASSVPSKFKNVVDNPKITQRYDEYPDADPDPDPDPDQELPF